MKMRHCTEVVTRIREKGNEKEKNMRKGKENEVVLDRDGMVQRDEKVM